MDTNTFLIGVLSGLALGWFASWVLNRAAVDLFTKLRFRPAYDLLGQFEIDGPSYIRNQIRVGRRLAVGESGELVALDIRSGILRPAPSTRIDLTRPEAAKLRQLLSEAEAIREDAHAV